MSVQVSSGGNSATLEVAGSTVAKVRSDFGESLNITAGAKPTVNGKAVPEDYTLRDGDRLSFVTNTAEKGVTILVA